MVYEPSYINGIVFSVNIETRPLMNYYHSFSVTPELPAGVKLDANKGTISGIPLVVINGTYTITATSYKAQLEESTTIVLDIEPCNYPTHIAVLFEKINSYSYDDLYTVIDSAGQTYNSPSFSYRDPDLIYYCFPTGTIDVHLGHEKDGSWDSRSRLNIKLSDGEGGYYTISSISRNVQCVNDFSYDISFKIYPHSSSWTYTTSLVPNWYGTDSVSGFSPYDPSNPPSSNGQYVWFFRTSVNMNSTSYVGFELRVKARAGLVVYVNGIEFLRKNLPEGEITTTTGATGGDVETKYHVVTGPNSVFNEGSNVIAIGIVNLADSNPNEIIFDATLQQLKPNDAGRSIDLTITTLPTTITPEDLYDFSYSSYWNTYITDRSPNQYFIIDYQYDSHRSEYFNEYCITSADKSRSYDPSDWTVYGSKDGTNFEVLSSSVNFRFPEQRFTKCFYMLNHKEAYSIYRLNVTKVAVPAEHRSDLYIAELVFSLTDVSHIIVPDLSYDKTSYTGYVGAPFPKMTSSSIYFTGYTISPKLPSSLELDTFSGSIVGTPQHIMSSSTYTISAKNIYDEIVSVQLTLSVEECELPNNLFTILIQSSDAGEEMGFTLKNSTGTTVFTQSGFSNKQANYYPQCRPTDTYTLTLTGQNQNSWTKGSFKVLLADDNSLLFGTIDNNELSKDFKFYIGYLVAPMISSYKYLNNNSAPPDDWNQLQISSTDSWKEARPGEFGNFAGITAYFRKTFTITSFDNMVSLSFSFRTNYGLIAYINGQNVYSFNMPKEPISYRTKCNNHLYNMANVGSTFPIQANNLVVGTNVLSIEVHRYTQTEKSPITIDSLLYLVVDNSYRVIDGKDDSETGKVGSELLFDNMRNTVHVSSYYCTRAIPQWVYNDDRREVISSYTVINGPTCNVRTPSGWRIEGSNDGNDWLVLHEIDHQIFTKYGEEKIYNFYNTRGFNRYRMVVTECINQEISEPSLDCGFGSNISFQLAEWGLYAKNQVASCKPTEDGFDGALEGQYTYKDCELYYEGVYKAKCVGGELVDITNECTPKAVAHVSYGDSIRFVLQSHSFSFTPVVEGAEYTCSISPSLPFGVNFDPSTGTISGKYSATEQYSYRVECYNKIGSASTSISIHVLEYRSPYLVWIILAIVIVLSLVFLTLYIINRVKMQKRHQNRLLGKYSSVIRAESSRREYDDLKRSIFV